MRIIDYNDIPEFHNKTKTIQHLGTLLGERSNSLGLMVKLKKDLTLTLLTDGLARTYIKKPLEGMTGLESMIFDWNIETTMIPKIKIMEDCSADGRNKTPVPIILEKNFYSQGDTFALENQQTLFVTQMPEKLANNRWRYICTLVDPDPNKSLSLRFLAKGKNTTYRSNYQPELSNRGYSKYMYNVEKHRGYISRHRHDDSVSSDYAANGMVYFEVGKDNKQYFRMPKAEKNLLDLFMLSRNNNMLFGRTNFDATGKCTDFTEDGRPIPMSDGVIAQIERYCDKFNYNVLDVSVFEQAIHSIVTKKGEITGNDITIVCNYKGWRQAQSALESRLREFANDGAWYFTKDKQKVEIGGNYYQYNYNGNKITFTVDKSLSEEYEDRGYLVFIDTSIDGSDGRPNLATYTFKGRELITGTLPGLGGEDGTKSGTISSLVDGTVYSIIGYSGIAVFNPYTSFIMQENLYV